VIKIGAILPLTGDFAWLGQNAKKGIDLGIIRSEKEFGLDFRVYYGDSKMESKTATSLMNKMTSIDSVDFFIVLGTQVVNSLIPISFKNQKIMFVQTIHPNITLQNELLYRLYGAGDSEWQFLAGALDSSKSVKKIGTFMINSQYGKDCYKSLNKYLSDDIENIFTIEYPIAEYNFKDIIAANLIEIRKVDAIVLMGYGNEYLSLLKQLKEYDFKGDVYGNIDFTFSFLRNNELAEGAKFVAPRFSVGEFGEESKLLIKQYFKTYGTEDVSWDVANSYDNIRLLGKIITMDRNTIHDPMIFYDSFAKIGSFSGASGLLEVDKKSRTVKIPLIMAKIENSKIIKLN
jgi:branched-chain amino acid transport system substrate-binding protein